MTSFAVLNEEKKIQRRKEKEHERKEKIREKINEVKAGKNLGNWADASEDDDDDTLYRPVSDSESDSEEDAEAKEDAGAPKEGKPPVSVDVAKTELPKASSEDLGTVAPPPKSKKDRKKEKHANEKDFEEILAEFGGTPEADSAPQSAAAARRQRKKEREAQQQSNGTENVDSTEQKAGAATKEKKAEKEKAQENADGEEGAENGLDEATKQAALEALKKKLAGKGKKTTSEATKLAAAEAKKRAANKPSKKDKTAYDL
mmetsp:Transcript_116572/g.249272  ORF Transcript_116572/g.249272 Transcript_116572/m.249272 type:complete len:259 (-) Transcript_116572:258-1034(-)